MPIANITLDCVNGISKQDAETLKALPGVLDALNERVTALEDDAGAGNDWELFDGMDWSEFSTDGKANQDLKIVVTSRFKYTSSDTTPVIIYSEKVSNEYEIHKGDVFSNTNIDDKDKCVSFYVYSQSGRYYFSSGSVGKFLLRNISGNSSILESSTVKTNTVGSGILLNSNLSTSASSSNIIIAYFNDTVDLTKNGTGDNSIRLYYRPKE